MWRKLADVVFWIGVSVYFGGLLVLGAVAAPAIFHAAESAHVSMPGIAEPPLVMHRQVGGEIFGAVLNRFAYVEATALALMLAGIAAWVLGHKHVRRSTWVVLICWVLLATLAAADGGVIRPRVWALRTTIREQAATRPAADAKTAWPERDEFDRLHALDETFGRAKAYLLLAMLAVTAWRGLAEKSARPSADGPEMMRKTLAGKIGS
jgi:hypothetical protein